MTDGLSTLYQDLMGGSYDCVDPIVLNASFRMGHDPGGFRVWWRALTGSDETLENAYLMRLAGGFSPRIRGYAKAHDIPVIDCPAGQRKHDLAEEYLAQTKVIQGLFVVLVGRAQAPVWDVGAKHHIERKKPMPYVNHYSFHILDPDWGHLTIKISGHPPFPAQVILNGHEYVACQARKAGIAFTKEGNCFTTISDAAGLAKVADTLSEHRAIGRLSQVGDGLQEARPASAGRTVTDAISPEFRLETGRPRHFQMERMAARRRPRLDVPRTDAGAVRDLPGPRHRHRRAEYLSASRPLNPCL